MSLSDLLRIIERLHFQGDRGGLTIVVQRTVRISWYRVQGCLPPLTTNVKANLGLISSHAKLFTHLFNLE
ncbi:MAG: hypothetical protein V7K83_15165 [Nostoc sp.]